MTLGVMRSRTPSAATLFSCALLACSLFGGCQSQPPAESWLVLERTATDKPEIVSVIRRLPSPEMQARFPVLLEIAWGYKSLPNGLPTEDELVFARTLYAGLDKIIGPLGIHAMTRTGDGGRTMYYYVTDAESPRKGIRELFDAQPSISVKVVAREDPDWQRVREVLSAVKH